MLSKFSVQHTDPTARGGDPADGRKVKGATIHWVDAATAADAEVRVYGNLFSEIPTPTARIRTSSTISIPTA